MCEYAWGGGEGVRGEGEEVCEGVEGSLRIIRHQSDYVGGACQSNDVHHQWHAEIYRTRCLN